MNTPSRIDQMKEIATRTILSGVTTADQLHDGFVERITAHVTEGRMDPKVSELAIGLASAVRDLPEPPGMPELGKVAYQSVLLEDIDSLCSGMSVYIRGGK